MALARLFRGNRVATSVYDEIFRWLGFRVKQPSTALTFTTPGSNVRRVIAPDRLEGSRAQRKITPVRTERAVKWQNLEEAKVEALECTKCSLSSGRTQVVWLDGNIASDLMFVGEAPGYHEDRQGRPFVGAAGQLLDNLLAGIGLDRTKCVICNVLKCRPPANRNPEPEEIELCSPYLEAQIRFIRPSIIVPLGNFATRFLLNKRLWISHVRGRKFEAYGATVIPTFHPASALHSGGAGSPAMAALRSDFNLIKQELLRARMALTEPVLSAPGPEPAVEQGSLF
jgi:uracil-DNA glycosylase family 4